MFEYTVENNIVNGFYTPVQQKCIDNFFIIYYLPYHIGIYIDFSHLMDLYNEHKYAKIFIIIFATVKMLVINI